VCELCICCYNFFYLLADFDTILGGDMYFQRYPRRCQRSDSKSRFRCPAHVRLYGIGRTLFLHFITLIHASLWHWSLLRIASLC